MAAKKSLYEILGIEPDANEMDIGLAHQRRSYELKRIAQPDPNALGLIQQAFEILSNPKRRAAYDASLVTQSEKAAAADQPTDLVIEDGDDEDVRRRWLVPAIVLAVIVVIAAYFVLRSGSPRDKPAPAPVVEAPKPAPPPPPPQPMRAEQILPAAMRASGQLLGYGMSGNAIPLGIAFSVEPGTVVTTCHGMSAGSKVVFRQGAETMSAELTVVDEDLDLCKLAIPGLAAKSLAVAADEAKAGDKVFVLGVNDKGDFALTEGSVKQVRAAGENRVLELSTPIAPTASGGAVLDAFGRVAGIATTPHRFGPGVNAAISSAGLAQMRSRARAQ